MSHTPRGSIVVSALLTLVQSFLAQAQDPRANMSPALDPGHNAHQEVVIFGCLVAIAAMLAVICLLLWFLVARSKSEVRDIKRVLPQVVDIMRANALFEDDEGDGQVVSGTMRAPEFEAGFMTSSSMADNTVDRLHPRYDRQHQVQVERQPAESLRSARDVTSTEGLTNHIASSSQSNQSQRTNRFDSRVQQGRARTTFKHENIDSVDVFGVSNHGQGEVRHTNSSANQRSTLHLGDFPRQSTGRNNTPQPELSARVEVSTISARETGSRPTPHTSHAYDNPDMMSRAYTPTNHIEIITNDQDRLKYRNSYYESHV